jgi:AP-3 complex subunit mu
MIQSLFLLSPNGQVLIERHFRGVVTERAVCEAYWMSVAAGSDAIVSAAVVGSNVASKTHHPVLEVPSERQGTLYVISILHRDGISYLAICPSEVSPLTVLELLHRMAATFTEYFGCADETAIKDNFATIYQLLDEMVDFGWPLTTELNALKAMIRPPTVMSKLLLAGTNSSAVSDALPSGTVSNMPWRTAGVHYTNNEIYVDILEEVDAIVDLRGNVVSADVQGSIVCQSQLSGVPDLLLTFNDPRLIDDCSFHPCVRYAKFENEGVVSFVPPDGHFTLMEYRLSTQGRTFVPPVYCHAQWSCDKPPSNATTTTESNHNSATLSNSASNTPTTHTGRLALQVGVTTLSSLVLSPAARKSGTAHVEEFSVSIPFPKGTKLATDFRVNMGSVVYDEVSKVARWNVAANMEASQKATLSCKFTVASSSSMSSSVHKNSVSDVSPPSSLSTFGVMGGIAGVSERRRQRICSRRRRRRGDYIGWLVSPPNLSLGWKIPLASVSGIAVSGLSVVGETYQPYKGVRNVTQAGIFQVRCSS